MNRLVKAGFISGLFTVYGGSIYYVIALFSALVTPGGDVVKAFVDTLLACFVCWLFGTVIFYEILGAFDELNKPRRPQDQRDSADDGARHNKQEPQDKGNNGRNCGD